MENIEFKSTKSKKNKSNFGKNLSKYLSDFSDNATIHGVKYLGEKDRTIPERLCWLIAIITSFCLCVFLITNVYRKWSDSPIIVSFTNTFTPIWEIPFPAITVCPAAKTKNHLFSFEKITNMLRDKENLTFEMMKGAQQLSIVCGTVQYAGNKSVDDDIIDFYLRVSPNPKTDRYSCIWKGILEGENCDTMLFPLATPDGICYTFNMLRMQEMFTDIGYHHKAFLQHELKSTDWNLEKGYPKDLKGNAYPRRTSASRTIPFVLTVSVYKPDLDHMCLGPTEGFKIYLHNPAEMPYNNFFMVPINQEVTVHIKPDLTKTADDLETYSPQKRKCYFSHERQLTYFRVYTQTNCQVECLANFTLVKCACVGFYMPRYSGMTICGAASLNCMYSAEEMLNEMETDSESGNSQKRVRNESSCNCLPACTSLSYNIETSQTDYKQDESFHALKDVEKDFLEYEQSSILFTFKEQQFITTERKELFGLTDFVANCGGLLGLFIGFSFLSVVEIVYFLSLRLICNIQKHGAQFWSGAEKKPSNLGDSDATSLNMMQPKRF